MNNLDYIIMIPVGIEFLAAQRECFLTHRAKTHQQALNRTYKCLIWGLMMLPTIIICKLLTEFLSHV